MDAYRIIVADVNLPFRLSIKRLLFKMPGLSVVGEAGTRLKLFQLVENKSPDLAIVDTASPELGGVETVRQMKQLRPYLKIISLNLKTDPDYVTSIMQKGIEGYLLKQDADIEFLAAVTAIRKGLTYRSSLLEK